MDNIIEDFMTKEELANYLKISTRTLDKLVLEGHIIKSKRGRDTLFRKENIERYIERYIIDVVPEEVEDN